MLSKISNIIAPNHSASIAQCRAMSQITKKKAISKSGVWISISISIRHPLWRRQSYGLDGNCCPMPIQKKNVLELACSCEVRRYHNRFFTLLLILECRQSTTQTDPTLIILDLYLKGGFNVPDVPLRFWLRPNSEISIIAVKRRPGNRLPDLFAMIYLDGKQIYTTNKQLKTLAPCWDTIEMWARFMLSWQYWITERMRPVDLPVHHPHFKWNCSMPVGC